MNRKVIPFAGNSSFIKELKELVHKISPNNASIMLVGKKGTGKRLFAQHLHADVNGDFDYFFEVNCKAFDYKRITDIFNAVRVITGYENRITLYVSFVDLLSEELQLIFLKLIEDSLQKGLNLKLVCSIEDSMEGKVTDGVFSANLYYRLNAIVLNMLPLNQRKDDILPIAEKYFLNLKKKSGYDFQGFSDSAKDVMLKHLWIGNVDELIIAIQRAFIVGKHHFITPEDLGILQIVPTLELGNFNLNGNNESVETNIIGNTGDGNNNIGICSLKMAVNSFKKFYLTKVLKENKWNQTKTAKILGIQRTYVIRLMNELQIRKK